MHIVKFLILIHGRWAGLWAVLWAGLWAGVWVCYGLVCGLGCWLGCGLGCGHGLWSWAVVMDLGMSCGQWRAVGWAEAGLGCRPASVGLRAWSGLGAWAGRQWALCYGCAAGLWAVGGAVELGYGHGCGCGLCWKGMCCSHGGWGAMYFPGMPFFPTANGGAMCAMACCVGQRQCPAC